jgi:alpha 1,3-mannosyltransferase
MLKFGRLTKRRQATSTFLVAWLVTLTWWVFTNYFAFTPKRFHTTMYEDKFSFGIPPEPTGKPNKNLHKIDMDNLAQHPIINALFKKSQVFDSRGIDQYSTNYKTMLAQNSVESIILSMNFEQRCDYYFKSLFTDDINWFIDPNHKFYVGWKDSYDYKEFRERHMEGWKKEYVSANKIEIEDPERLEVTKEFEAFIKKKYEEYWTKILRSEQQAGDFLSHLRIFNKCYITNDDNFQRNEVEQFVTKQREQLNEIIGEETKNIELTDDSILATGACEMIEKRIYPWLSFSYPLYERWTGELLSQPPTYAKYLEHRLYPQVFQPRNPESHKSKGKTSQQKSSSTESSSCFLKRFKNSLNGKGIVMSIADKHVEETVSLIRLLRALNNKYPIQIVYFDDLSKDSRNKLVKASREILLDLPQSFHKVQKYFPDSYLSSDDGTSTQGLPKQELWFVNVHHAIHTYYRDKFDHFGNKFFATLFNSFEEYILVDADTVLTQNPEYFFNLKGYKDTGAYFYRDRLAGQFRPAADGKFFKKMSPSNVDQVLFDIPIMTDKTTNLVYFDGMYNQMESGLVVIDRTTHFSSVLMILQLHLTEPAKERSYGDKELFWLGFSVNGDEKYHFNEYPAAAIGTTTDKQNHLNKFGKERDSEEVCSSHPGHISGEDGYTLAWFNSGFQFCAKADSIDFENELEREGRFQLLGNVENLKELYRNPVKIQHAIVPPFKNKWETYCPNEEDEPSKGWECEPYCLGYLWCAYSKIGGTTNEGNSNVQTGTLITFKQKEIDLFTYYGDIWSLRE